MGDSNSNKTNRLRFPALELFSALHGGALALRGRPLTTPEKTIAREIFQSSIDLEKVRVVSAVVANAPTTLGNFIRVGMDGKLDSETLIHELAHVWQFQTKGTAYISDSICHQVGATVSTGSRAGAYQVTTEDMRKAGSIHNLPAEKQAMVVQYFYADKEFRKDRLAQKFIEEVRSAKPLSQEIIIEEAIFGPGMGIEEKFPDLDRGFNESPPVYQFRYEFWTPF